ncbi:hypothetical protein BC936DRAFT_144913 [Jimgerdemannia flammicorona]|uniref:Uncharacterized protein n=2 Tax=Jimgerdemannia flammicorona TaxID=994334 RepID=A0A433QMH7_9FUNG|nr:hypothetical protein BC936DRAFT_144913 [Jimgerdemannia flammicorona]RUS30986.1 hypothetical protein BC938DRAFT_478659 [Jimgerdemannia flammicorona]
MKFVSVVALAALAFVSTTTALPKGSEFATGCDQFHNVVEGDGCDAIANEAHITLPTFFSYNHGLHKNCDNLDVGSKVCIHVKHGHTKRGAKSKSKSKSKSASKSKPKSKSTTTPTGMCKIPGHPKGTFNCACVKFHTVVKNDDVEKVAKEFGISLDDLFNWNKGLHRSGDNLDLGSEVCVGLKK